ncbi:MAG: N-acetylmuramoyl-L-alanine amidase family protein [Acidimicrobiales bacterium]
MTQTGSAPGGGGRRNDDGWFAHAVLGVWFAVFAVLSAILGWFPAGGRPLNSSYFATGSCMSYRPTAGNRHLTVFLDAGHGGVDPGAIGHTKSGKTIYESSETLPVEMDVMNLLRAKGFTVVVSRTRASTVLRLTPSDLAQNVLTLAGAHKELIARDVCANTAKANVLVGIYFDAGSSPSNAGCLTLYDPGRRFSASNLRLAQLLQSSTLAAMNKQGWAIPNGGARKDFKMGSNPGNPAQGGLSAQGAAYGRLLVIGPAMAGYFNSPSQMPGAIIEPLFITDPFEASIANSSRGQHVMAEGIAAGIEKYFRPPGR